MILTERFRSREGFLYTVHWHETGLEAFPTPGLDQPDVAGSHENRWGALAQWCAVVMTLGEPAP